jgi:hypothetical protein
MLVQIRLWILMQALLIAVQYAIAQESDVIDKRDLVGVWQEGGSDVAAGYRDRYRFSSDGEFAFEINQMLVFPHTILRWGGHFQVSHDTLKMTVEYRIEIVGGRIARGDQLDAEWKIVGGKEKRVSQSPCTASVRISQKALKSRRLVFRDKCEIVYTKIGNNPKTE